MEIEIQMNRMFYANVDPRRKQELSDSRMIFEDQKAPANLYQDPIYHTFDADEHVEHFNMYNQSRKARR